MTLVALMFEARWTMLALRRVDDDLAEALTDQRDLFRQVCVSGSQREVVEHGAAMLRGYAAAMAAMENADVPDDAYQVGRDPVSGCVVAIAEQKAASTRVIEQYGTDVIFVTPDEIAALFGSVAALKQIGMVKRQFPTAEIIEVKNPKTQKPKIEKP